MGAGSGVKMHNAQCTNLEWIKTKDTVRWYAVISTESGQTFVLFILGDAENIQALRQGYETGEYDKIRILPQHHRGAGLTTGLGSFEAILKMKRQIISFRIPIEVSVAARQRLVQVGPPIHSLHAAPSRVLPILLPNEPCV